MTCLCNPNANLVTIIDSIEPSLYLSEDDYTLILFQCLNCKRYLDKNMMDDKGYIDKYYEFQAEMQKANQRLLEWCRRKTKIIITFGDTVVVRSLENFQFIPHLLIPPQ